MVLNSWSPAFSPSCIRHPCGISSIFLEESKVRLAVDFLVFSPISLRNQGRNDGGHNSPGAGSLWGRRITALSPYTYISSLQNFQESHPTLSLFSTFNLLDYVYLRNYDAHLFEIDAIILVPVVLYFMMQPSPNNIICLISLKRNYHFCFFTNGFTVNSRNGNLFIFQETIIFCMVIVIQFA